MLRVHGGGNALYFDNVDPEIVQATIDYLSQKSWMTRSTPDFQTKLYKFAICLRLATLMLDCVRS